MREARPEAKTALLDIKYSKSMDINSSSGMGRLVSCIVNVAYSSCLQTGVFCTCRAAAHLRIQLTAEGDVVGGPQRGHRWVCPLDGHRMLNVGRLLSWIYGEVFAESTRV